jgi:hypothetical protein
MRKILASAFSLMLASALLSVTVFREPVAAAAQAILAVRVTDSVDVVVDPPRPLNFAIRLVDVQTIVAGPFAPGTSPIAITSITIVNNDGSDGSRVELIATPQMACDGAGGPLLEFVQLVVPDTVERYAHLTYPAPMVIDGSRFSGPWCLVATNTTGAVMHLGVVGFYR